MGKRRKKRRDRGPLFEYFRELANRPDFLVIPTPPGFGIVRPEYQEASPLLTGQVFFDDPFWNVLNPPPFGEQDPVYPYYARVLAAAERRQEACPHGQESPTCTAAREAYFAAAREYSYELDHVYGLRRFQEERQEAARQKKAAKRTKKRT